jgi:uncharacterized protein (TIGR02246 family)
MRALTVALTASTLLLGGLFVVGCGGDDAGEAAADPIVVMEQWIETWNTQDLDAYAALYAEDATETFSNQTYEGREAIRDYYEGWKGRFTMECTDYQVSDNTVTYRCVLTGTPGPITGETMEAVIADGKIESIEVIGRFQP